MNRRSFIAAIPFLPAAVKAALCAKLPAPEADLWKCVITPNVTSYRLLSVPWIQMSRTTACYSMSYLDTLDIVMGTPEPERKKAWHDRRKDRCRQSIAYLKTQRPLPLP